VLKHPTQDALKTLKLKKLDGNSFLCQHKSCEFGAHLQTRTQRTYIQADIKVVLEINKTTKRDDTTRIRRRAASTSAKEARPSAIKKEEVSKQFERRKKARRSLKGGAH
jgi:hypothetical protein